MPPPPLSDFWGFIVASFSVPSESHSINRAYYANSVYVNAVDVSASRLEHSWVCKMNIQICFCSLWGNGYVSCELNMAIRRNHLPTNAASTGRLWELLNAARAI